MTTNEQTVGRYLRWLLAALSVGAGVIHFSVSGEHYDMSWLHGSFFAAVAWLQLGWAVGVILRPSRRLLQAGVLLNAGVIGVWAMSRIWGVPVDPQSWTPEPVALADALSSGFEAGIVVLSLAVLVRPALASQRLRPSFAAPSVGFAVLGVAVFSSMAIAPAFASDHHGGGGHGEMAAGHHGGGVKEGKANAATAGGHGHAGGSTEAVIQADGTSACEQAGVANAGNSGHGHRGPVPVQPIDAVTRDALAAQVAASNAFVAAHPTAADAEASGYRRITPYVPCIAAHYIKSGELTNPFDPNKPEIVLYDGTEPTSKIVGLSYLQFASKDQAPEGFAGPNDPWHVHEQLCLGGGGVLGDESTTEEECAARGGRVAKLGNLWMNHMWNVPGWESRWGLFSSEHPDLGGTIGNLNATPEEVATAKAKAEDAKAAKGQ
jgi:hypothetical protein